MFNYSGNSMWPLCYSIMSLPPSLKDKPHVGKSCHMMLYYVILCACYITSFYVIL